MTFPVAETVRDLIRAWLPTQRWFPGKGRTFSVEVHRLAELSPSPQVTIWTARADYGGGEVETYQVPLVARSEPVDWLEHVLLGTVETEAGLRWVYDALHDKEATPAWLAGMRDASEETDRSAGPIRFQRFAATEDIPVDEPSLVMSGEQSNTSMVFGDIAIMKVFRRLQPGVNPDIEVQSELTALGAKNVARMLGAVTADIDGTATSLAFAQEFMTSATDGWVLATSSVRDLMAEADLHAEEAGGDFAAEAERLGEAVAAVHADLATAFGTRTVVVDELRSRAQAMQTRLQHALRVVPQLSELAPALADIFAEVGTLTEVDSSMMLQRIHGDLHLGQALRTVHRWVLIDFEGEPMAGIESRRELDFPIRDIAGMLRSFEYAGHHRIIDVGHDPQLSYRAAEWSARNRSAFCDGYAAASGSDPRAHDVLLRAFEADKAVYEAVYEARNRPPWLPIPLASLTRLATGGSPA